MGAAPVAVRPESERVDYDIFISYSRRDKDFVRRLYDALAAVCQKVWVDWNDIPPAEDWRQEIARGIAAAHNFVFIISSHSIASTVCGEELAQAMALGKRLVPLVRQDVGYNNVPPALARLNWIFFQDTDDFDAAFQKLVAAIETDVPYVRAHTRLLMRAREWEAARQDISFLLRGSDLQQAEAWFAQSADRSPQPTALQRDYIETSRRVERERQNAEIQLRRLTPQQLRNRQAILSKVRNFWISGVLEHCLTDRVLIQLGLEARAESVASAWHLEAATIGQTQSPLPPGTRLISIFDSLGEGRTLLILGEPGSGKTTALLELTRDLIDRAEQGVDCRIPVVFNLASWGKYQLSIADWLVNELNSKYQIPKQIGQDWVNQQELLLLLDGLDEVSAEWRDRCVAALNDCYQNYSPELVVCSRSRDYAALTNQLNFQSAIHLRSLTPAQVNEYLGSLSADLSGLRSLLASDRALQELAASPLMLNVMVLAYQGIAPQAVAESSIAVLTERRNQLFDAYIHQMFQRPNRQEIKSPYSLSQIKAWLSWLSRQMNQESESIFFIEQMQPALLQTTSQFRAYGICVVLLSGLAAGLLGGLLGLMIAIPLGAVVGTLAAWVVLGLGVAEIKPVETLQWSWQEARQILYHKVGIGLVSGLAVGCVVGLIPGLLRALSHGLKLGVIYGLIGTGIFVVLDGLRGPKIETKTVPNQGMWNSAQNALLVGAIGGILGYLLGWLLGDVLWQTDNWRTLGLIYGLVTGLMLGGGKACLQHLSLRLVLHYNQQIPWNYAGFLDFAAQRVILQKVGGGYIFLHRLLQEHFAQMKN
jgi:GTPase SAR1 family protein